MSARAFAVAAPMPREPPDTSATLPVNCFDIAAFPSSRPGVLKASARTAGQTRFPAESNKLRAGSGPWAMRLGHCRAVPPDTALYRRHLGTLQRQQLVRSRIFGAGG